MLADGCNLWGRPKIIETGTRRTAHPICICLDHCQSLPHARSCPSFLRLKPQTSCMTQQFLNLVSRKSGIVMPANAANRCQNMLVPERKEYYEFFIVRTSFDIPQRHRNCSTGMINSRRCASVVSRRRCMGVARNIPKSL